MTDSNKTPPVLSPQQIVRARYKQQMMPPRTWKQQQARQEQIEAVNHSRQVTARQAFTAAAAKASSSAPQTPKSTDTAKQGSPVLRDLHSFSKAAEQPPEPLHASRRGSSASSTASNASSDTYRPSLIRRSSSSSSVSRAAVLAAQNSVSRSPHNSASSRLSSVASSRRGSAATLEETVSSPSTLRFDSPSSTSNSPSAEPKPLRPTQLRPLQTGTLPSSGLPSKGVLTHGLPTNTPLKTQAPRTVSQSPQRVVNTSKAPPVQTSRVNPANAAASASVRKSIPVEPQAPLSSKFASSLTRALKKQQDLRLTLAEELALEAITDSSSSRYKTTAPGRHSQDSVRSVGSTLSTQSGLSTASLKHQNYAISPDSFLELKTQQQQQQKQQNERRMRTAEENKANALRAAVAAGSRVETDMASIHIQVNEAVQTALKRQNRKLAMQKYRPAASWSSTRMFRPQLRRLQTSDSLKGADLLTPVETPSAPNLPAASPSFPISGPQSAGTIAESPRSAPTNSSQSQLVSSAPSPIPQSAGPRPFTSRLFDSWTSKSNSEISLVDSEASSSPGSQGLPEKWICEPPPKVNMTTIPTKQTSKPAGKFLSTLRSHPRASKPSRNREIVVQDPLPSQSVPWPNSQAGYSSNIRRSSMEMRSGFDFRNPSPQQSVEPQPQIQLQPLKQRMPKTLREYGSPRFNQDKPWKGHREATELSVRERKRYESLWAANKDVHLPYMCVPVKYQKAWIEVLTEVMPELFNQKSGTPLSSATLPSTTLPSTTLPSTTLPSTTLPSTTSTSTPKEKSAEPSANLRNQLRIQNTSPSLSSLSIKSTSSSVEKHDSGSEVDVESVITDSDGDVETENDNLDMVKEVAKWKNDVHGYVVARLWRRSCLAEETLAQIWDLVDNNKDGTLDRSAFVVGMWLCDQCLYGRKLPTKVPSEVWQSVGSLNLKVRFKQKRSKIGYVRGLPNMVGNAVGFTMHGGRQIVKKTVQNATK